MFGVKMPLRALTGDGVAISFRPRKSDFIWMTGFE
jgi:hypothetical protein